MICAQPDCKNELRRRQRKYCSETCRRTASKQRERANHTTASFSLRADMTADECFREIALSIGVSEDVLEALVDPRRGADYMIDKL
jgi:hypothetical protein